MRNGRKSIIILFLTFFLAASINMMAQETQKQTPSPTDKMVTKLQQKVLLTDDQATKVKSILVSYLDGDKSSENIVEAQRRIEALFDAKQKAKYDIIKEDWWKSVNKSSK